MCITLQKEVAATHALKLMLSGLVLVSLCGCGISGGAGASPGLIPVKGKITFKGKPLTKGTVVFDPDDYGRPARGELKSDGTFELTTDKEGDGVVAGHHRVYVTDLDVNSKNAAVPKKYSSATSSKLEAEVSPEKTDFTFEIP